MGALATTKTVLIANVANGGSFTLPYPTGSNQALLTGSSGHQLVLGDNDVYRHSAGLVSFTFGASEITVTNTSGELWLAGTRATISFGHLDRGGTYTNLPADRLRGDAEVSVPGTSLRRSLAAGIAPSFRRRELIATIGDSRKAANYFNPLRRASTGPEAWACALSHQTYRLIINRGQSGKRTDEYLTEEGINAIIDSPAGIVTVLGALNDIGQDYPTQGTSGATAAANVIRAAQRFIAAGLIVVLEADPGQNGMAAVRVAQLNEYNARIREFCERSVSAFWHDARPVMVDPAGASNTVTLRAGMHYDGTHASPRGSYYWGKSLRAVFDVINPPHPLLVPSPSDLPTTGRFQLLNNPVFASTGGTSTTGVTGTIPGNCRANKTGANTAGAMTTAVQNAVMNVTFGAQGDNVRLTSDVDLANWNPGEWLQAAARVAVTNPNGLSAIELLAQVNGDGATTNISDLAANTAWVGPDESFEATLLTDPFRIPAMTAKGYIAINLFAYGNAAGAQFPVALRFMSCFRRLADYAGVA